MDLDKEKLIEIALKRLDIAGLVGDVIDEVAEPALKKFVADSANPYDDMLVAALLPVLKVEVKKIVEDQLAKVGE